MIPLKVKGITIDLCQESGYIWFDRGEYQQILERTKQNSFIANTAPDTGLNIADFVIWDTRLVESIFDGIGDLFKNIGDTISVDF